MIDCLIDEFTCELTIHCSLIYDMLCGLNYLIHYKVWMEQWILVMYCHSYYMYILVWFCWHIANKEMKRMYFAFIILSHITFCFNILYSTHFSLSINDRLFAMRPSTATPLAHHQGYNEPIKAWAPRPYAHLHSKCSFA